MEQAFLQKALEDYIACIEAMTPRAIRLIEKCAAQDMVLDDPLCKGRGLDDIENAIEDAFAVLDDRPKIKILDWSLPQDKPCTALVNWHIRMSHKRKAYDIYGKSEIMFTPNGTVMAQTNYWDAGAFKACYSVFSRFTGWLRRSV